MLNVTDLLPSHQYAWRWTSSSQTDPKIREACHALLPVSRNVSWNIWICLSLVLFQPNPKRCGSSRVSTPVSWQMSLSRKNVLTPSLSTRQSCLSRVT